MQFPITLFSLFVLLSTATAAPTEEKRQGGFIFATQTYYSGAGCTGTADGEATFGGVNLCQPISSVLNNVISITADSVTNSPAGCSTTIPILSALMEILWASLVVASKQPLLSWPLTSSAQLKQPIFTSSTLLIANKKTAR
ncbi:hypothetical protein B7494_g8427 [Chlorociboria aeruginascens]|nr:hypothetical protein B7494_g8427 [Chlorociboria aeruginascens]